MMLPRSPNLVIFCLLLSISPAQSELQSFVSANGEAIKAELVSHKDGKVTIRREDGREFEVDPTIFCAADQKFLADWMERHPEMLDYKFRINGTKKKMSDHKKTEKWVYVIAATNLSQDTVSKLNFDYRVVYKPGPNSTTHQFHEGKEALEESLEFNKTFVITTTEVKLRSRKGDDGDILGCLLRISDSNGEIVHEWVSDEVAMQNINWDSKPADDEPGNIPAPGSSIIQ